MPYWVAITYLDWVCVFVKVKIHLMIVEYDFVIHLFAEHNSSIELTV